MERADQRRPAYGPSGYRLFDQPVIGWQTTVLIQGLLVDILQIVGGETVADQQLFKLSGVLWVIVLRLRIEFASVRGDVLDRHHQGLGL